jgi:DNA-binding transcriptional LysR family regulator
MVKKGGGEVNLQTLRYFVSLARIKSYTKAAEECYISQPALSRSISELENEIGCHLVNRNSRSVELTEEGVICLAEAKKVLKQYDILIDKVTNANQQFKNPVKIGYIIYGHIAVFNKKLSQISKSNLIKIDTEYDSLANIQEKLQLDEIDMAIMPRVCVADDGIQVFELSKSQLYVLVPCKSTLFNRDFVNFHDLKNQKFIGWDIKEVPLLNNAHSKACEESGFETEFVAFGKKMGDLMTLSILHNALAFASSNSTIVDSKEFKLIPVLDSKDNFGLVCIWKKDNKNPSVRKLIKMLGK